MTTILVTLIFLLSDGTPAKKAYVSCEGLALFEAGNDFETTVPEGAQLLLDSRGGSVVIAPADTKIHCWARQGDERWRGDIHLKKHGQVERMTLRDGDHLEDEE